MQRRRLWVSSSAIAALALGAAPAEAASCWDHNGSVMRLEASGAARAFVYHIPRPALRAAGVRAGALLFNGLKRGDWYEGTARRFSRCFPDQPQEYAVEGPVDADQLGVTVEGRYAVYSNCVHQNATRPDRLRFEYLGDCALFPLEETAEADRDAEDGAPTRGLGPSAGDTDTLTPEVAHGSGEN